MRSGQTLLALGLAGIGACLTAQAIPPSAAPGRVPEALRGCWSLNEPPSEEHPEGIRETLIVAADTLSREAEGVPPREGSVELVERLVPRLFEGRITAIENGLPVTLATSLELDSQSGELLLYEGDAGSYSFRRCGTGSDAPAIQSQRK